MARKKHNFAVIATSPHKRSVGTHLMLGRYFADIVTDPDRGVYHWIIQRFGSPEIVQLGQENSFPRALERAHHCLESLVAQSRSRRLWRGISFDQFR